MREMDSVKKLLLEKLEASQAQVVMDLDQAPNGHDTNKLIIIPVMPDPSQRDRARPFATIVALKDGESLSKQARLGLHVVDEAGSFDLIDGVAYPAKASVSIISAVPFPQLAKALLQRPLKWDRLFTLKEGEAPGKHVMCWHMQEDDYELGELDYGPRKVLELTSKWADFVDKKCNWRDIMHLVTNRKIVSAEVAHSELTRLKKVGASVGLHPKVKPDLAGRSDLLKCIEIARLLGLLAHRQPR
jgi:hypothetical protein